MSIEKLKQLQQLFEVGILTQAEYNVQKRKYLSELGLDSPSIPNHTVDSEEVTDPTIEPSNDINPLAQQHPTIMDAASVDSTRNPLAGNHQTRITASPRLSVGQYFLLSIIGEGGMGVVYQARHRNKSIAKARGDVAIKCIKSSYIQNPQIRKRFEQEAILGMRFQHPNLAKVLDFYEDENQVAFVMELISGQTLLECIPKDGMSILSMLAYLTPISKAIDYLHSEKVIHRDLKPSNIKIKEDETPVILDLGIAKSIDSTKGNFTKTGMAIGTVAYMAPEQMNAKNVTKAADVYSLAMIVYHMLSGRLPWDDSLTEFQIYAVKVGNELMPLHKAVPNISKQLSDVVHIGLQVNPTLRFTTCFEFVQAITNLKEESPPQTIQNNQTNSNQQNGSQQIYKYPTPKSSQPLAPVDFSHSRQTELVQVEEPKDKFGFIVFMAMVLLVIVGFILFVYQSNTNTNEYEITSDYSYSTKRSQTTQKDQMDAGEGEKAKVEQKPTAKGVKKNELNWKGKYTAKGDEWGNFFMSISENRFVYGFAFWSKTCKMTTPSNQNNKTITINCFKEDQEGGPFKINEQYTLKVISTKSGINPDVQKFKMDGKVFVRSNK